MAASRRIQILQVIRDAVDAVLLGGCDMPRQRGLDFTKVPRAVVYPREDAVAGEVTRPDGGPGVGGTDLRTLTVVVDVYLFDPDTEPVSLSNPTGEDASTVERLDEQLVLVESAIKALSIEQPPGALATTWRQLVDESSSPRVSLHTSEDGQRMVGGQLLFTVNYHCAERDPSEAA